MDYEDPPVHGLHYNVAGISHMKMPRQDQLESAGFQGPEGLFSSTDDAQGGSPVGRYKRVVRDGDFE